MILLLFISSALLHSSVTVRFPNKRVFLTVFLILPSLCLATVTQHPIISNTADIQLNSGAAAQIPSIIGHNLDTAVHVSSKIRVKNRNSIIRQHHCPSNTFRCGDGSCIPKDWIDDGEVDCDDLSDEHIQSTTQTSALSESVEYSTTAEEIFDDPFDRIVTFSSIDQLPFSISPLLRSEEETKSHQSYAYGCSNIVQTRVNQCSTDLTDWMEHLDDIDLTNSSMLNDETSNNINLQGSPICQILASIRSDLRCIQRNNRNGCTTNALEIIEPLESETDHLYTQLACSYITAITASTASSTFSKSTDESSKLKVNGSPYDILHMFTKVNTICSQIISEAKWEPIYRIVCEHREKLMEQRECFINASLGLEQCDQKPKNETICNALEQFSNNIDCALRVMLDVCTIEAQNVAVLVQDALSDDLIVHHCYAEAITDDKSMSNDEFKLSPKNVRCTSEQENLALACLVELVEVNRKIAELNSLNFLHEISQQNSTIISGICNLYNKYDNCISNTVFVHSNGKRCAFNSPLNTLARIGLAPICSKRTRTLLHSSNECIQKIKNRTGICQSGLNSLGLAIHNMLQGIHGEAYLCNSYYLIRDAYQCGEKIFIEFCSAEAIQNLQQLWRLVMELGVEEGCPKERPKQKQFASCIQTITTYQPHPLAVIKQPKQIDEACKQFVEFKKCQANISCIPLWAKGMIAMFDFACGPGYSTYLQVRQCIRKTTTRENIRECVSEFSRSSPQIACQSSRKLLACSIPVINEKCGQVGAQFVTDYIDKFVNVVDPTCKIGMQQNDKSIRGYNCTIEENARISYCAAPINELTSRIDELFEGGLQQFLVNVKNLAPVFAKGCNLTKEFRHCLGPLIEQQSEQQCTISSCLIQAGNGICNQPDTAKAIDDNLACVFKQASIPEFGRCLRSTIATLKQFNLIALRGVLPQFIKCIEHIVVQHCGEIPLNVLRAISATDICPISFNYNQLGSVSGDKTQICDTEMQQKHAECTGNFYRNYRMLPIALLRDPSSIDMLCVDASKLATCSYPICDTAKQKALNALAEFICTRRDTYKEHSMCLTSVITSSEGSKCLTSFLPTASEQQCSFLTNVANCATPSIHNSCGYEALALSFEGMHIFANALNKSCSVQIPIASVKTSCAESDIVEYLQCENLIDHFTFAPFSFIRNSSQWNEFCEVIRDYENCLTNMSCRVEPISSANIALFRTICGKEESKTKYFLPCLTHFITTDIGKKCSEPFVGLDLLAKDNSQKICSTLKSMLSCASSELSAQCSEQALKHVVSMFLIWVRKFDPSCSISGYGAIDERKIEEDFSLDSGPIHISVDQTALPVDQRIPSITTTPLLPKPKSDNSLSDSNNFLTSGSITVSEVELLTVSQPDSTSSSSDIESVSHRRTGISSTTLTVPELNPESINAENDFTDSTSSLQQSLFDISPKTKSNVTINAKKSKMQESGQMRSNPLHLWILSIVIIMSTIIMPFVQ
ncbi:Low-density lipoprotein receptor domain class A containing protein [Brugia malayi]|uniref:Bm4085, isoform c n=1 Tax=Brugia malayi TaxID=6279 RepID=A0A1P6BZZ4_BRUMA|nr:Low-density lipoprotein receptor domain class A containing protein [Brugia malayi]CDP99604.2 Bm4085, isoform c [Brugia malayi]VIO91908.1 Low-density lipoprotein receptor domain class A containing protein [Brugia malayi]